MFDIGASELLVIVIVAVLVIGPKDLPLALRTAGRWIGKIRRVSAQFRSGFDAMVREAEMEEMEKKWREQNARIMAENPDNPGGEGGPDDTNSVMTPLAASAEGKTVAPESGLAAGVAAEGVNSGEVEASRDEPMLPLGKPEGQ
ncbi:Sec-independent protein translocase protein TatB [Allopontixanthobacter sp.]|uniref:Sec-independent protein translocase protein TatB n=1 Tax=Allopontixanthobacter sp. TaxID=2906452 RepID=UPI002AB9C73D|nr:Sec-independent protein translocase protein TatB [Allopontixanthobacter sp.]MDZ4306424.1 Sec-independent protein translocase protein TatB [Allopontixanthobacter sp.]